MPILYSHIIAIFFIFGTLDVSKCEIRCQLVKRVYHSRLQTLLVFLILNVVAKTNLAVLYCRQLCQLSSPPPPPPPPPPSNLVFFDNVDFLVLESEVT